MAAALEVCSIDMMELGAGRGIDELEAKICRLLKCDPGRVANELQVCGYIIIRNLILRHVSAGFRLPRGETSYSTVRFPQGGLVVVLEIDGNECVATLRWDSACYTPIEKCVNVDTEGEENEDSF